MLVDKIFNFEIGLMVGLGASLIAMVTGAVREDLRQRRERERKRRNAMPTNMAWIYPPTNCQPPHPEPAREEGE